jgi:hypothetical protein
MLRGCGGRVALRQRGSRFSVVGEQCRRWLAEEIRHVAIVPEPAATRRAGYS